MSVLQFELWLTRTPPLGDLLQEEQSRGLFLFGGKDRWEEAVTWLQKEKTTAFFLYATPSPMELAGLVARLEAMALPIQVTPYLPVDVVVSVSSEPSATLLMWLQGISRQALAEIREALSAGPWLARAGIPPDEALFLREQLSALGANVRLSSESIQQVGLQLTSSGPSRIMVIKALRGLFDLGLKEAKDLTEDLPKILATGLDYPKAVACRDELEEVGAKCVILFPMDQTAELHVSPLSSSWQTPQEQLWTVYLLNYPRDHKIRTIKLIKDVTKLGLKEAKELSESLPAVLKAGISQAEAQDLASLFRAIEAGVSVVGAQSPTSARPSVAAAPGHTGEALEYDVILDSAGAQRIEVLKVLRALTKSSLVECKQWLDQTPSVIGEHLRRPDADSWLEQLKAVGATARLG